MDMEKLTISVLITAFLMLLAWLVVGIVIAFPWIGLLGIAVFLIVVAIIYKWVPI